jgi:hypothetical protein
MDQVLTEDMSLTAHLISDLDVMVSEEIESMTAQTATSSSLASSSDPSNDPSQHQNGHNEVMNGSSDLVVPVGDEWQVLRRFDDVKFKEAEKKRQEILNLKKMKFKEALDYQIKLAREAKARQSAEYQQYTSSVENDVRRHRDDEIRRAQLNKKKSEDELRARRMQMEEVKMRRQKELDDEKQNAQLQIRLAQQGLENERRIKEEKHQKVLETRRLVELSNEENKRLMTIAKEKERDEDNRLMQEYSDKIEREDMERQMRFKKRMEGNEMSASRFAHDQLEKTIEKRKQEEWHLLLETQRKEAADAAHDLMKETERKRRLELDRLENDRMREYHRLVEANEQREKEAVKERYRQELENNKLEEDENRRKKRYFQQQYRSALLAQMKSPTTTRDMEGHEREINMSLLRQAVDELPQLVVGVVTR